MLALGRNRIRKVVVLGRVITNPKLPAPMRGGAFSAGVEAPAGRTVYVSGQVSMDAAGNVVGEGDIRVRRRRFWNTSRPWSKRPEAGWMTWSR